MIKMIRKQIFVNNSIAFKCVWGNIYQQLLKVIQTSFNINNFRKNPQLLII